MTYYCFKQKESITLPKKADNPAIIEILHNYTPGIEWEINFCDDDCHITVGSPEVCDREGAAYVISVSEGGIYAEGSCYRDTARAFVSIVELIFCYGKRDYRIECDIIRRSPRMEFRSAHICIRPETTLLQIRKVLRSCGIAKFSHVVLEFFGSLEFDCMKELAWPGSLKKDDLRPLIAEANALGVEIIPFYQHLGHASMSRLTQCGKHVVLDQNMEYDYLYYPKSRGWVWNFPKEEIRELLRKVRAELIDLCGEGEYFHIGCDESGYTFDADELTAYLNEVSDELKNQGRRAIIWGDMLLSRKFEELKPSLPNTHYECNSTPEYANALLDKLSRDIIIADWQYNANEYPWKSSLLFKNRGFDVIACPWNDYNNIDAALKTADTDGILGVMKTTWHQLFTDAGIVRTLYTGLSAWGDPEYANWFFPVSQLAHDIYRRVSPRGQKYEDCGWFESQK